jgi:hypothetical protein
VREEFLEMDDTGGEGGGFRGHFGRKGLAAGGGGASNGMAARNFRCWRLLGLVAVGLSFTTVPFRPIVHITHHKTS